MGDSLAGDGAAGGAGAAFVIDGSPSLGGTWDLATRPADYALYGPAAQAGLGAVLDAGDLNGDGQADLAARTATTAYVMFGPLAGATHLATTPADVTVTGLEAGGLVVMDFTGDGQADSSLAPGRTSTWSRARSPLGRPSRCRPAPLLRSPASPPRPRSGWPRGT